jgi:hypothetical protein
LAVLEKKFSNAQTCNTGQHHRSQIQDLNSATAPVYKYPMPRLLTAFMSLVALTLPLLALAALTLLEQLL